MRGGVKEPNDLFSYRRLEEGVAQDHPLRAIRELVEAVLAGLHHEFEARYSTTGRPSIPPEPLLKALLLQAFFTIRSERQLMEQLDDNLLFRWFTGLAMDAPVWDATTFCSMKSFRPREEAATPSQDGGTDGTGGGRHAEVDFRGEKRSNNSHASTTDPEARLYRKSAGAGAKLCFMGHALMENRNDLIADAVLTPGDGQSERGAALAMIEPMADRPRAITLGADKAYDTQDFVNELRSMRVTPHVAQNTANGRASAIDGRTTRHKGYAQSIRVRKRIEEAFGWIKTIAGQRKTRFKGIERAAWASTFVVAAYHLVR